MAVVDMTPDVGYCSGQYCDASNIFDGIGGGDIDPFLTHTVKHASYGLQSRLTARAIVVQGGNGKRIALVKTDNYLAQDTLIRRVGQILESRGSGIGHTDILHHVTHNHSSSYSSTPAWGVAIFQDAFDPRFFEHQARQIAAAILAAEADMRPARMGATEVRHRIYKGNVVRLAVANDGTPAGYPLEFGDQGLVVMRFDDISDPADPQPLAVWVNWGEHPESLDGYNLHSADFLAAFERFVDRDLGVPVVFSQGDVGSAENTGNSSQILDDAGQVCDSTQTGSGWEGIRANCPPGQGVVRDWEHEGYIQTERAVRYLADDVVLAFGAIAAGGEDIRVPMSDDFVVDTRHYWAPGPLSQPYPAVSNCNAQRTADGDVGVPVAGLPDCGRYGIPGENPLTTQAGLLYATAQAEGIPLPDHYNATAFTGVEENARIYLQAFRLGEVLLASCACEAQVDLILNLETRTDAIPGNQFNGFDWACLIPEYASDPEYAQACALQLEYYDPDEYPTAVPGNNRDPAAIAHMRAQVHNDAAGWDSPANALFANTEPNDPADILGNFSHEELPPEQGYALPVGVGHAGDYNGYTVSYREFMNRDHYRKALTAYGPHTADYMASRLVRMAGAMKGGPELVPELQEPVALADEARQEAQSLAIGQATA
ncbi:MAG: neutral/alkaline non-lysosomal ceramidase N-terminal domain-containing protein, partial [Oceanococcaceae bacterium]